MITAGIFPEPRRLVCCLIDDSQRPRYLEVARTDEARQAVGQALRHERVHDLVMVHSDQGVDPLGQLLLKDGLDVWLVSATLLGDLTKVLRGRRCGPRTCAAILARMSSIPTWFAALRPLELPIIPPTQLHLL